MYALKAYGGSRIIVSVIQKLGTRSRRVVSIVSSLIWPTCISVCMNVCVTALYMHRAQALHICICSLCHAWNAMQIRNIKLDFVLLKFCLPEMEIGAPGSFFFHILATAVELSTM